MDNNFVHELRLEQCLNFDDAITSLRDAVCSKKEAQYVWSWLKNQEKLTQFHNFYANEMFSRGHFSTDNYSLKAYQTKNSTAPSVNCCIISKNGCSYETGVEIPFSVHVGIHSKNNIPTACFSIGDEQKKIHCLNSDKQQTMSYRRLHNAFHDALNVHLPHMKDDLLMPVLDDIIAHKLLPRGSFTVNDVWSQLERKGYTSLSDVQRTKVYGLLNETTKSLTTFDKKNNVYTIVNHVVNFD